MVVCPWAYVYAACMLCTYVLVMMMMTTMMMITVYTVYMMNVANIPITTRYTLYEFGLLSDDDTSATPSTLSNAHMHTHTFTLYTREEHTRPPYWRSPRPDRARPPITTVHLIVTLVYCNARDAVVTDTRTATRHISGVHQVQRSLGAVDRTNNVIVAGCGWRSRFRQHWPYRRTLVVALSRVVWRSIAAVLLSVEHLGCWHDRRRTDRGASDDACAGCTG